jgi:hypothetical protein
MPFSAHEFRDLDNTPEQTESIQRFLRARIADVILWSTDNQLSRGRQAARDRSGVTRTRIRCDREAGSVELRLSWSLRAVLPRRSRCNRPYTAPRV